MKSKKIEVRLSTLEVALLTILLMTTDKKATLSSLEKSVYKMANKAKPKRARQSIAVLVRSTGVKLKRIQASLVRSTPIGRGNEAEYALRGNLKNVEDCLAWNFERG